MSTVIIIAAVAENGVIGLKGQIPWHIGEDLKLFKSLTLHQSVIMGRKTFESIGKALPRRQNIVLSATLSGVEGITVFTSLQDAVTFAKKHSDKIFIIGGAAVYAEALPLADELAISHIRGVFEGDTFFPKIEWRQWECIEERPFEQFIFKRYIRQREKGQ